MLQPRFQNKGALLSECRHYRYVLWRIWDDTKPCVMFIMLNPSTADENDDDSTIRKCIQFAAWLGYGGIYVGNLFSYRAANPAELKKIYYQSIDIVGAQNDNYLTKVAEKCNRIIFAWGNNGEFLGRSKQVAKLFSDAYCLSYTQQGSPKHPLYLSGSVSVIPYK